MSKAQNDGVFTYPELIRIVSSPNAGGKGVSPLMQETPHNSQPALSTAIPAALFLVAMNATTYNKEHEHQTICGLVILLASALAAALVLWAKLHYML